MRNRIFTMLIAITLLFAAPMLAQSGEEQETDTATASATAELTASTQEPEKAEMDAEVDADVEAEQDYETTAEAEIAADDRELPQTAGFLPLLALLGLGSLATALGLRALRK